MSVLREVPIAHQDGENSGRVFHVFGDVPDRLHAGGLVCSRKVDVPDVECTFVASESEHGYPARSDDLPAVMGEPFQKLVLNHGRDTAFPLADRGPMRMVALIYI